ncbi:MAG: ATP-binding protein [FCB group bacterium]|jgi:two-component system CheB/CheR fusion protein|nr:ATP-binding protein [FCB group bacterium]
MDSKQVRDAPDIDHLCRALIEQSPLPMAAVGGLDHVVRYANPAFCRLVGKRCEDLLGSPFDEAVPEAGDYLEHLDRVARTGGAESGTEEKTSVLHAGHWAYGVWAIINAGQQPIGVMVHLSDATEAVRLRERLVTLNEELLLSAVRQQEIGEERRQAQAVAEISNAAKDQFLAVVSHELRTPLTPVLAAVSMLQRDASLSPAVQDALRMIRRNVETEARLIDDLLDLTRITQGKVRLDLQSVDLAEVIASAVETCGADIKERQLEFGVDAPDAPYLLEADPSRLRQVLCIHLKNAVKFTPAGGCVGIRCRRNGPEQVIVEINDSGCGIAPEMLSHLFHAFHQGGPDTTRRFGGLGLGLVISKSLVEQHGGTVEAHSEGEGKGASFRIRLPLLPALAFPATETVPDSAQETESSPQSLRILYVEDHGDTAAMMRELLEMEGHRVHTATDVASALETAAHGAFDVLVSDLGLPDGSGHELMRRLRAGGKTWPAIALSGYGHEHNLRESHEAGFTVHLVKPVSVEQLLDALAQVTAATG